MNNHLAKLLILFMVITALPVSAQFRRERKTANKEYELKAFNLAIDSYKKALARRPADLESLSRIADSYRMLNQMQTAHNFYQQAVRDKKVDGQTMLQHAHVLKALSRYDEAKQWYLLYARDHDVVIGNHYAQSADFAKSQAGVDAGFTVQSIEANSPVSDFGASVPSPQQLVFNSARTAAGEAFEGQATNRPYVASVNPGGNLQTAYPLETGYNEPTGNVGPVSYTPDGRQVVFTRNNFVAGTRMIPDAGITMTLMTADVNDQGDWLNPRPLPFNGTDYNTGFGTFSPDGNTIYFTSNRPGGFGGYDVYRVNRSGSTWESVPENIGAVVNSIGHELTPYHDGQSLFFSSDYHHGMGAFDVFRAELAGGRPTTLFHMGAGINSDRDDLGFVYDPSTAGGYVTSNRIGGKGMEDVYRVGRAADNKVLVVQSATDGSYLANVAVDFSDCGGQVYATDASGRYVLEPIEGLACNISISTPGYQPVTLPVQNMQVGNDNTIRVTLQPVGAIANPSMSPGTITSGGAATPPGSYRGVVTNAETGYAISMANVKVTQRATGASANILTDVDGAYFLQLTPNTIYDVEIMASGFEPVRFPISNANPSDPNILGNTSLLPGQGNGGVLTTAPPSGNTGATPGYTTPPATSAPPASNNSGGSGFSVQLASLRDRPDLSKYANVTDLGRVYDVDAGSSYKVRLGVFPTRAQAVAAANSAKASGYDGAFVVADSGPASPNASATAPPTATQSATTGGRYKVQLGAYGQPQNFNRTKASGLGNLETLNRGNLTLFMIGGLNSMSEAQDVQSRARSMGYDGAFILEDKNGELTKVR